MMEWKPIEQYDARKFKPNWCVFYVEAHKPTGKEHPSNELCEMLSFSRYLGKRHITMFCELPPPKP